MSLLAMRGRYSAEPRMRARVAAPLGAPCVAGPACATAPARVERGPVSYTHLTLPTICSV
eukprot:5094231-Alexandrium_andersonii.AAC.1